MDTPNEDVKNDAENKARMLIHNIKNSLSTIYLTIDSLRNAKEDKEDTEFYLQLLEKSARKIDEILNDAGQSEKSQSGEL